MPPLRPTELVVLSLFAVGLVLVPTALAIAIAALRRADDDTAVPPPVAHHRPARRTPTSPPRFRHRPTRRRFGRR